ncbi:MAG: zinc ribbon domain-containing protein [Caldilineales bacterium]|nr:zinc ribbon domain-containing protein [Caldilineales bacterium]
MKKSLFISTIITLLTVISLGSIAFAQTSGELSSLRISLWPEYDDPRLLVIIDGVVPAPGQTVRIPIPGSADVHAVATTGSTGGLVNAAWQSQPGDEGFNIVELVSDGEAFRVEYYVPLDMSGDQRQFDFTIPSGYVNTADSSIEILLPPDAAAVSTSPPMQTSDAAGGSDLIRQIGRLALADSLQQNLKYNNPSGALTIPEDTRAQVAEPQPAQPSTNAPTTAEESSIDPVLLILGGLALALIAGGIFWLWRLRAGDTKPAVATVQPSQTGGASKSQKSSNQGQDRFCRQCGTEFTGDDRFCRKCGAARR